MADGVRAEEPLGSVVGGMKYLARDVEYIPEEGRGVRCLTESRIQPSIFGAGALGHLAVGMAAAI